MMTSSPKTTSSNVRPPSFLPSCLATNQAEKRKDNKTNTSSVMYSMMMLMMFLVAALYLQSMWEVMKISIP